MKNFTEEPNGSFFISQKKEGRIFERGHIYSLADMKKFFAEQFFEVAYTLQNLVAGYILFPDGEVVGEEPLGLILELMESSANYFNLAELPHSSHYAERAWNEIKKRSRPESNYSLTWKDARKFASGLSERIEEELARELFLYVTQREYKRYREPNPFGRTIASKWPELHTDTQEANKCFVVRRYTACVFHSMRVIERVVQLIAHDYQVKPHDKGAEIPIEEATWDKLLTLLTNHLGKHTRTGESAKDSRMREITVSLDSVRGIWRNPVAHPLHHYTRAQANSIFGLTKEIVGQVAALI